MSQVYCKIKRVIDSVTNAEQLKVSDQMIQQYRKREPDKLKVQQIVNYYQNKARQVELGEWDGVF